jgi:hypothetical protein
VSISFDARFTILPEHDNSAFVIVLHIHLDEILRVKDGWKQQQHRVQAACVARKTIVFAWLSARQRACNACQLFPQREAASHDTVEADR